MGQAVVVSEPEEDMLVAHTLLIRWIKLVPPELPGLGAVELPDDGGHALGALGLVGPGAGEDGGAPHHARAALARGGVAVHAGGVLVAQRRVLGVEVAVEARAAVGGDGLLQKGARLALHPGEAVQEEGGSNSGLVVGLKAVACQV